MANILLLGPERDRATGIGRLLRQDGHHVEVLRGVEGWRRREAATMPDLVVAVTEAPDPVLAEPGRTPRGFPAPLLFVRPDAELCGEPYLDERLVDQIKSPFLAEELLGRADALVRVRRSLHREDAGRTPQGTPRRGGPGGWSRAWRHLSALLGSRVPRASKPLEPYLEVAARVADWADRRDAFAPGHAERVTRLCAMMADGLGLDDAETAELLRAAMLHDIGKVALPVEILHRAEPLEEHHRRLIRTHPRRGATLLRALDRDDDVALTILHHHECPDGSGYYGLSGTEVPRSAYILSVAEVYDAMTNSRLREPLAPRDALARLKELRGTAHDSDAVDALVSKLEPRPGVISLSMPVPADAPTWRGR